MSSKHNQRAGEGKYGNPLQCDLGFRLKEKRLRAGQSIAELANLLGVTPSTISNWERGKMGLRNIPRVIKFIDGWADVNAT